MSLIDIFLLFVALAIFTIFFKQIFTGNHPKRGVDFEAKVSEDKIGGVNRPDKIFKKDTPPEEKTKNRVQELFEIAQDSLEKGDNIEAKKALQSLLILEPQNTDAMRMLAVAYNNMYDYSDAKQTLLELLEIDPKDDLAHSILANTLHKLGEDEEAIKHHKIAIELDPNYAKHYYNYANTLLDLGQKEEAIKLYKKALELEPENEDFKKTLKEIEQ
jgi:tetratricopeptide (TPR) repeat protein